MSLLSLGRKVFGALMPVAYWVTCPFRYLYKRAFGYDVFISYSRKDALPYAQRLESALRVSLICYRDEGDASGGRPLEEIIGKGVLRSRALIVVVTAEACASGWVRDELASFRGRQAAVAARGQGSRMQVFPIFLHPCTPENLPEPLKWLRGHLGCKDPDANSPSARTIEEIRYAFHGIPRALKLYGATALVLLVLFLTVAAFALARMSEKRRLWLGAAARAEAAGRIDQAELLVARAVESDVVKHWEDEELYARLRERRMLIPGGYFLLREGSSVRDLFSSRDGLRLFYEDTVAGQLELCDLSRGSAVPLLATGDHVPRSTLAGRELWVAVEDRLVARSIDDGSPLTSLRLPGACHELRAFGAEIRILCETPEGASLVLAKKEGAEIRSETIVLRGGPPPIGAMMLSESADSPVCSLTGGGLRVTVRNWSRTGEELSAQSWSCPDCHVDSPELVQRDRYVVFTSQQYYPGMDRRKEPEMLAVDRMWPPGNSGGREVQQVSPSSATLRSLNRSKAFAAAIGSGGELRFWDAFNPPLMNQYSTPVTDGMRSFETWEHPVPTPYYARDAAVVLVAKDTALEVYAERYEEGARRPSVNLVARYPLEGGFETGRTLVSADGEHVGVVQSKPDGERTVSRIALFRRAGYLAGAGSGVPRSGWLAGVLGLQSLEVENRYLPAVRKQ